MINWAAAGERNTNSIVTHIDWGCVKTTQLCGSFIRPGNVILITSSASAHMSCTNATTAKSFSLSHTHAVQLLIVPHEAACVCPHACCLNSTYGEGARQQLGLAWITALWLDHCSSDTPLSHTHFLSFIGLLLTSVLRSSHPPVSVPSVLSIAAIHPIYFPSSSIIILWFIILLLALAPVEKKKEKRKFPWVHRWGSGWHVILSRVWLSSSITVDGRAFSTNAHRHQGLIHFYHHICKNSAVSSVHISHHTQATV